MSETWKKKHGYILRNLLSSNDNQVDMKAFQNMVV